MSEQARLNAMYAEYDSAKKSPVVAWVLWIFLGGVGGHRYYLGNIGYAIAMTLLAWATFGIWWIVDAFFINRRIRNKNREIYHEIAHRYNIMLDSQLR
ncbi:TM2 domain-containing protein [Yaniella halotolerans]|uniref:TM2 domain-containing protein n=1 Tax=Yaniella halotolerans TaxID=225453 RepID=UPI0003B3F760|nr:TM2 domain-containing protein [Yaniella halotolerans]